MRAFALLVLVCWSSAVSLELASSLCAAETSRTPSRLVLPNSLPLHKLDLVEPGVERSILLDAKQNREIADRLGKSGQKVSRHLATEILPDGRKVTYEITDELVDDEEDEEEQQEEEQQQQQQPVSKEVVEKKDLKDESKVKQPGAAKAKVSEVKRPADANQNGPENKEVERTATSGEKQKAAQPKSVPNEGANNESKKSPSEPVAQVHNTFTNVNLNLGNSGPPVVLLPHKQNTPQQKPAQVASAALPAAQPPQQSKNKQQTQTHGEHVLRRRPNQGHATTDDGPSHKINTVAEGNSKTSDKEQDEGPKVESSNDKEEVVKEKGNGDNEGHEEIPKVSPKVRKIQKAPKKESSVVKKANNKEKVEDLGSGDDVGKDQGTKALDKETVSKSKGKKSEKKIAEPSKPVKQKQKEAKKASESPKIAADAAKPEIIEQSEVEETKLQPKTEDAVATSDPESHSKAQAKPDPKPVKMAKSQSKLQPKPEPETKSEPEPEPKAEPEKINQQVPQASTNQDHPPVSVNMNNNVEVNGQVKSDAPSATPTINPIPPAQATKVDNLITQQKTGSAPQPSDQDHVVQATNVKAVDTNGGSPANELNYTNNGSQGTTIQTKEQTNTVNPGQSVVIEETTVEETGGQDVVANDDNTVDEETIEIDHEEGGNRRRRRRRRGGRRRHGRRRGWRRHGR